MCFKLAATYTWWGPFGTTRPEAVMREAMTTKTMRTGSTVAITHNVDEARARCLDLSCVCRVTWTWTSLVRSFFFSVSLINFGACHPRVDSFSIVNLSIWMSMSCLSTFQVEMPDSSTSKQDVFLTMMQNQWYVGITSSYLVKPSSLCLYCCGL